MDHLSTLILMGCAEGLKLTGQGQKVDQGDKEPVQNPENIIRPPTVGRWKIPGLWECIKANLAVRFSLLSTCQTSSTLPSTFQGLVSTMESKQILPTLTIKNDTDGEILMKLCSCHDSKCWGLTAFATRWSIPAEQSLAVEKEPKDICHFEFSGYKENTYSMQ